MTTIATTPCSRTGPPTEIHGSSAASCAALRCPATEPACGGAHASGLGAEPSVATWTSKGVLAAWATNADSRPDSNALLAAALGQSSTEPASDTTRTRGLGWTLTLEKTVKSTGAPS